MLRKFLLACIVVSVALIGIVAPVTAATILLPVQGGTGSTTLSGILVGNAKSPVNTLIIGTNLSLVGTTLSASGGSSGGGLSTSSILSLFIATYPIKLSTTSSSATFSFPSTSTLFNGTPGQILAFLNGQWIGAATSTFSSPLSFNAGTNAVSIQPATASQSGYETQNEFNYVHSASTTYSGALVYTGSTNAVTCTNADGATTGCLTGTDWTKFNQKVSSSSLLTLLATLDEWTHPAIGESASTSRFTINSASSTITNLTVINGTTTNATSTNYSTANASTSNLTVSGVPSAILKTDAAGKVSAYGGAAACTNQFLTALSALGSATCTSVTDSTFSGQLGAAHGGTGKDFSGSSGVVTFSAGVASTYATSSPGFYAPGGTNGQVLGVTNGVTGWVSTSSVAGSSASSTLLSDNNTFSGFDVFTKPILASTTIGNGTGANGLTIFGGATTTLLHLLQGGFLSLASSTVGNGGGGGGLTIFGNSTTTGLSLLQSGFLAQASSTVGGVLNVGGSGATSTFRSGIDVAAINETGSASSTFVNGIDVTSGCFAINHTCVGGSGGSGTVNSGSINQLAYYASGGTAVSGSSLLWTNNSAMGIGSTTPWAALSIASSTPSYTSNGMANLLSVATSSDPWGYVLGVFSTSSTLVSGQNPRNWVQDSGARVAIGTTQTYDYPGLLDQLTVNGRINYGDWRYVECAGSGPAAGQFTADASNACGPFGFQSDTTGADFVTSVNGILIERLGICASTSGDTCQGAVAANVGAGFFFPVHLTQANSVIIFATTTPQMDVVARINTPANASSSSFYIGFTNLSVTGSAFEVEPTAGCYINASSTSVTGDWYAVCRTSAGAATYVDTGFASSTNVTSTGGFYRFRIAADNNGAKFYMASSTASMRLVANITTNVPTTVPLSASVYLADTAAGTFKQFDVNSIKLWFYQPALNYIY